MIFLMTMFLFWEAKSRDCYCSEIQEYSNCAWRNQCFWDPDNKKCGEVLCNSRIEDACEYFGGTQYCFWDQIHQICNNYTTCSQLNSSSYCFQLGCSWNYFDSVCNDSLKNTCRTYSTQEICSSASQYNGKIIPCVWHNSTKSCTALQQCQDIEDNDQCVQQIGCKYSSGICQPSNCSDYNSSNCLPYNPFTNQMCIPIGGGGACGGYTCDVFKDSSHCYSRPYCYWNLATKDCELYSCQSAQTATSCITSREDYGATECAWTQDKTCQRCAFERLLYLNFILVFFLYMIL